MKLKGLEDELECANPSDRRTGAADEEAVGVTGAPAADIEVESSTVTTDVATSTDSVEFVRLVRRTTEILLVLLLPIDDTPIIVAVPSTTELPLEVVFKLDDSWDTAPGPEYCDEDGLFALCAG
jgi:hypothetical protein